jgi:membrane-bound acyltransferase YfiQ involved in biofilm formation
MGYLFGANHERAVAFVIRTRWINFILVLAAYAALHMLFLGRNAPYEAPHDGFHSMKYLALAIPFAWLMTLTLIGFFARNLNGKSTMVALLNRAIFPSYIIHQTVTVAAAYYLVNSRQDPIVAFAITALVTAGGSAVFYLLATVAPMPIQLAMGLQPDGWNIRPVTSLQPSESSAG